MITSAGILKAGILIVDDRNANASPLERMLRGAGYGSITIARDPDAVCDLHRKNHYSLILLDLQMPGEVGFKLMQGLQAIEEGGDVAVVVQAAEPADRLRALKAGAKDFISKPFDLAEVLVRVYNVLEVRLLREQERKRAAESRTRSKAARASQPSPRRPFDTGKDGILVLDAAKGRIEDVNRFLTGLLGFSRAKIIGETRGKPGPLTDYEADVVMLDRPQTDGYLRYEELPLETRDGGATFGFPPDKISHIPK